MEFITSLGTSLYFIFLIIKYLFFKYIIFDNLNILVQSETI